MAEIVLCGRYVPTAGGPDLPKPLRARLTRRPWPGGGTLPALVLDFCGDTVEIRMIEREQIEELRDELARILKLGDLP